MTIDKQKLQPLLWSVVGAFSQGDHDLQIHLDALDEFLGEVTMEQVALDLLAEIERLESVAQHEIEISGERAKEVCGARMTLHALIIERDQLKAENEALRFPLQYLVQNEDSPDENQAERHMVITEAQSTLAAMAKEATSE